MADQNITQTTKTSTIPDWAQGYFTGDKGIFPQAQALAQQPYQAYTGQRMADFSGLTTQAMQGAGAMTPSTLTTLGGGIAGSAALNAGNMNYQGFQPGQFTGQAAGQYMNPFMQNVVDIQQREAQRQADIAGTQRGAGAVKAGAFGGSRQAVMDAEAARNLAIQKGDIQAQGLNQAFNQAQQQFNTEQQLAEQARQYGAGLGLQGLQTAIQGAGQLGTLGQQGFTQGMDINKLQAQYGSQQQALEQGKLDQQYQDFLTQQQYPYQQLGFYTDILGSGLRGASGVTSQASNMYAPPPSTTSQLLGLGTAALGAYGAFGKAEGGTVGYAGGGAVGYASGGISGLNPMELDAATDKMSDQQMQGVMGLASVTDLAKLQIAQKLAQNNMIRQAAQQAQAAAQPQPQGSIADEALAEMGIGGLDVPDETFSAAGGGIVAFGVGGTTLRDLENRAGIPYGTESRFELDRRKVEEANRQQKEKEGEQAMLPRPLTRSLTTAPEKQNAVPDASTELKGIMGLMDTPEAKAARKNYASQKEEAAELLADAAYEDMADYDVDQAKLGKRGVKREESINKQLEELTGQKDQNFNMALLETGLAMMAGTSPHALVNIGKAGLVGKKSYEASQEKLQARKDKLEEAMNDLEDARFTDTKEGMAEQRRLKGVYNKAKADVTNVMAEVYGKLEVEQPQKMAETALNIWAADRRQARSDANADARAKRTEDPVNALKRRINEAYAAGDEATAKKLTEQLKSTQMAAYAPMTTQQGQLTVAQVKVITSMVEKEAQALYIAKMSGNPEKIAQAQTDYDNAFTKAQETLGLTPSAGASGSPPPPDGFTRDR